MLKSVLTFFHKLSYIYSYGCMYLCGGQRTACRRHSSPYAMWIQGSECLQAWQQASLHPRGHQCWNLFNGTLYLRSNVSSSLASLVPRTSLLTFMSWRIWKSSFQVEKKNCPIDSVKCRLKGIYLIFLWHQFWWLTKPHCVAKCLDLDWKPLWSPCRIYCLPHGSRDPCRIHQLGKWSSPTQTHPIHSS